MEEHVSNDVRYWASRIGKSLGSDDFLTGRTFGEYSTTSISLILNEKPG